MRYQALVPQALASASSVSPPAICGHLTPTLHQPDDRHHYERQSAGGLSSRYAGRRESSIIEDGVYALGHSAVPASRRWHLERVFHVNGLSKTLGRGCGSVC